MCLLREPRGVQRRLDLAWMDAEEGDTSCTLAAARFQAERRLSFTIVLMIVVNFLRLVKLILQTSCESGDSSLSSAVPAVHVSVSLPG